ncbi:MAG: hypothetical protein GF328_07500, partial [Candidatus Latescibacteria bacterium]|nr:hypothetical protein [Candidatus Latescibacterota bacterium]
MNGREEESQGARPPAASPKDGRPPALLRSPWGARFLIALLLIAAYAGPLSRAELSELDDRRFILDNEAVQELSPGQVVRFFTDPATLDPVMWRGTYRPLRTLDFAIDYAIGGTDARVYHLHSLLIHLISSILVFEIFRRLLRGRLFASLVGALLFALHPVQTESVAWVTSRGDLLAGMYVLAALLAHLHRRYVLAAVLFFPALFSKETAVVFPAAALLADLFFRGRGAGAALIRAGFSYLAALPAAASRRLAAAKLRRAWREADLPWIPYAAYGALAAGFFVLWLAMMENPGHLPGWWGGDYFANLQMMVRGLAYYARVLLLPVELVFDYHVPATTTVDGGTVLGLLLLAGLVVGCVKGGATFRFATAWFFLLILPTSNLLLTVGIPTAERFLYLPSVGLALGAG